MNRSVTVLTFVATVTVVGPAMAQSTAMPNFKAPYRAFARHEFGATLSFPDGGGTGIEGQYGFGTGRWDIGLRAGFFDAPGSFGPGTNDVVVLAGLSLRNRLITASEDFPLDGALVVGLGGQFVANGSTIIIPGGVSLGRRLNIEDSQVSIIPYVQPTAFLTAGSNQDTDFKFALGIGADFRLSRAFDARLSVGLGDRPMEGVAISAIWVR